MIYSPLSSEWVESEIPKSISGRDSCGTASAREAEALSAAWRPWRAYAVMHLWHSLPSPSRPRKDAHDAP